MRDAADPAPPSRREWAALALILLLCLALRLPFLSEPFERDEGTYAAIGQAILRGDVPYRDAIVNKPPLVLWLYAAFIGVFGASVEGIRFATALFVVVAAAAAHWAGRFLGGPRAGLAAALLFALYSCAPWIQGAGSNCEVFLSLPILVSFGLVLAWSRRRGIAPLLGAGAAGGLAMLLKTTALPFLALFALSLPFLRPAPRRAKDAIVALAAFGLPIVALYAATCAWLAHEGALDEFVYWTYTHLKKYGKVPFEDWLYRGVKGFAYMGIEHALLWLLALPTAAWLLLRERTARGVLTALLVPAGVLAVVMPGQFHPHYFIQLVPVLAVVGAVGWARLASAPQRVRVVAGVAAAAAFLVYVVRDHRYFLTYTPDEVSRAKYGPDGDFFVGAREVGAVLRQRTAPDDAVFQWGNEPEVLFYADRRSPSPYLWAESVAYAEDPDRAAAEIVESVRASRAAFVVVARPLGAAAFRGEEKIRALLDASYEADSRIGRFVLWRRKE